MEKLICHNINNFLKKRITLSFSSETEATIFYYFVGAVTANLGTVENFKDFKELLEQISYLAEL